MSCTRFKKLYIRRFHGFYRFYVLNLYIWLLVCHDYFSLHLLIHIHCN